MVETSGTTATGTRVAALGAIAAGVVALDQGTKALALSSLSDGHNVNLVGSWLRLQLVFNSGAAFSIGASMTLVLSLLAVGVVVVIALQARKLGSWGWTVALGLLLGGAIGNLIDRFLREPGPGRGHVVDFIAYGNWFIGNVADIAIVAAAVLIVILSMRGVRLTGGRAGDEERVDDQAASSGTDNPTPPS